MMSLLLERLLDRLHDNVPKVGTVFNTLAPGTDIARVLHPKTKSP